MHHEESDSPRRGRRLFPSINAGAANALRHRADGYRQHDSPSVSLPGVQRLARRRCAPTCMRCGRSRSRPPTRAAAMVTPRQALALQLLCDGPRWRPSREFLALAPAESPPN